MHAVSGFMTGLPVAAIVIGALVLGAVFGFLIAWGFGRRRAHALSIEIVALESRLKSDEALDRERALTLERAVEQLRSGFDRVAGDSLRSNSEVFLRLAKEHLSRHQETASATLHAREKSIDGMLEPLREALTKTEAQIARIEKERAESFGSLREAIEAMTLGQQALQRETRMLVSALRRPEVRGRWGEMSLKRLVELTGLIEHADFSEQVHVRGDTGAVRPDLVVHMPDGRDLVVDVKTPLDAYLEALEAQTDEARAIALRRHAQTVRDRVRELASKSYWAQFENSPDFVVLFIPGDQFLSAALTEMPGLLEDAIRQNVVLATPSSLLALLKAVAYGWRQTALARNAKRIRQLGEDLHRRLVTFAAHLTRLGRSLGGSVDAYNAAVGSLERQVLSGARKFTELGISADRPIEPLEPIDRLARIPQSGVEFGTDDSTQCDDSDAS
jgi:DNA recombination protein RmuC